MSLSRLFKPYCVRPLYFVDTITEAGTCGAINGLIYALVLSIVFSIIGARLYNSYPSRSKHIMYVVIGVIVFIWIVLPALLSSANKNIWQGYNDTIDYLLERGYSREDVINIIRSFESSPSLNLESLITPGVLLFKSDKSGKTNQRRNKLL